MCAGGWPTQPRRNDRAYYVSARADHSWAVQCQVGNHGQVDVQPVGARPASKPRSEDPTAL
eukprot:11146092-Alexandrium_andersonii.AAC.1